MNDAILTVRDSSPPRIVIDRIAIGDNCSLDGRIIGDFKELRDLSAECGAEVEPKISFPSEDSDTAKAYAHTLRQTKQIAFSVHLDGSADDFYGLEFRGDWGEGIKPITEVSWRGVRAAVGKDFRVPNLTGHFLAHRSLKTDTHDLYFEAHPTRDSVASTSGPGLIAFYHSDPVTGEPVCGKTDDSIPLFAGHNWPRIPFAMPSATEGWEPYVERQIRMAKHHGLRGFCFWVENLNSPLLALAVLRDHPEWEFAHMVAMDLTSISSSIKIEELAHYLVNVLNSDDYLHDSGKPLVGIRGDSLLVEALQNSVQVKDQVEIEWLVIDDGTQSGDPVSGKHVLLEPHSTLNSLSREGELADPLDFEKNHLKRLREFHGLAVSYRHLFKNAIPSSYPCVTAGFDNSSDDGEDAVVVYGANPEIYGRWLMRALNEGADGKRPSYVFLNSWNGWHLGTQLEPDIHLGYSLLNETSRVIKTIEDGAFANRLSIPPAKSKLAVILHAHFTGHLDMVLKKFEMISEPFDLFITTQPSLVDFVKAKAPQAFVIAMPNRGRDVYPFLHVGRSLAEVEYEYVLKVHIKKSPHHSDGEAWFLSILDGMLPGPMPVNQALRVLGDGSASFVGPAEHFVPLARLIRGAESETQRMFDALGIQKEISNDLGFFVGTMFWARIDALRPILDLCLSLEDFPAELGQINKTAGHALERTFAIPSQLDKSSGRVHLISSNGVTVAKVEDMLFHYPFQKHTMPVNNWSRQVLIRRLNRKLRSGVVKTRKFLLRIEKRLR